MKYAVQRMTEADYNKYMSGALWGYDVQTLWVEADTAEAAAEAAKEAGYVVNERYVRTAAELEAEREAEAAREAAIVEREANAKAKREATEARKAAEAGQAVEEYRRTKARKAKITRLEREVAELRKALAAKEKELEALI